MSLVGSITADVVVDRFDDDELRFRDGPQAKRSLFGQCCCDSAAHGFVGDVTVRVGTNGQQAEIDAVHRR